MLSCVSFNLQGLNAALFYENKDPRTFVSLIPTSAHSGDGMGNLIALLVELTQTMLARRLAHCDELRAQVMEVRGQRKSFNELTTLHLICSRCNSLPFEVFLQHCRFINIHTHFCWAYEYNGQSDEFRLVTAKNARDLFGVDPYQCFQVCVFPAEFGYS